MSRRRRFIAANWKMHKTGAEARSFAAVLRAGLDAGTGTVELAIAPSFTALAALREALADAPVHLTAQDLSKHDQGAFTGEVSGAQLRDAGCSAVIIGHSERRQYHGETDSLVADKLSAALRHGLLPIVCIGETSAERDAGRTEEVVLGQLEGAIATVAPELLGTLVLAYEPVWAIGTGRTATPADAQSVHAAIRSRLARRLGDGHAQATRILYGGSVKPENAVDLLAEADIDGALVGGASLDADAFLRIVRAAV